MDNGYYQFELINKHFHHESNQQYSYTRHLNNCSNESIELDSGCNCLWRTCITNYLQWKEQWQKQTAEIDRRMALNNTPIDFADNSVSSLNWFSKWHSLKRLHWRGFFQLRWKACEVIDRQWPTRSNTWVRYSIYWNRFSHHAVATDAWILQSDNSVNASKTADNYDHLTLPSRHTHDIMFQYEC